MGTITGIWFPRLSARDLDGCEVILPAGLPGEWNAVIVAFRRQQQELADSWAPWLEKQAATIPGLGFAELPAIGPWWRPARPVIDGGMSAAIRDQQTRRRTLTVYTGLRRVTLPLGIGDRNTIWLFLTDRAGQVRWRGSGGWNAATAAALAAALAQLPASSQAAAQPTGPERPHSQPTDTCAPCDLPGHGDAWIRGRKPGGWTPRHRTLRVHSPYVEARKANVTTR